MPEATEELSIADVLIHYGATSVPEGVGWKSMRCPFHADSVASGRVNVDLNAYKCHGCKMSGDAIKLIEINESLGYGDAIEFARSILGKGVEDVSRSVPGKTKRRPMGSEKWKKILG
jgi:DNA primase